MPSVIIAQDDGSEVSIPSWIKDNASFIRWAEVNVANQRGRIGYFQGTVWIDRTGESLLHNQIKLAIAVGIMECGKDEELGRYYGSGMMFSCPAAQLSSEPDGFFVTNESMKSRKVWLNNGDDSLEVYGVPDLVFEVVEPSTAHKDLDILPGLYHQAGIKEYWVIKGLYDSPKLVIYQHAAKSYIPVRSRDGWVKSQVLQSSFRLVLNKDVSKVRLERK